MEIGTPSKRASWMHRIVSILKTGFIFSLVLYLVKANLFSDGGPYDILSLSIQGLLFGTFMEVVFYFGTEKMSTRQADRLRQSVVSILSDDEQIEVEGPVSMQNKIERAGGRIYLTNRRVVFQPNRFNIEPQQVSIPYRDIKEIENGI